MAIQDGIDPRIAGQGMREGSRVATPQQQAIFAAVAAGESHLLVEALAGTGKTSVPTSPFFRLFRFSRWSPAENGSDQKQKGRWTAAHAARPGVLPASAHAENDL